MGNIRRPQQVILIHRSFCEQANCKFLDKLDYNDPCICCPDGHFAPYMQVGCEADNEQIETGFPGFLRPFEDPYPTERVGTELKILLAKFGLKPAVGCKCHQHITEMDARGIDWCEENIDVIVGWLKEEAARSRLPFFETGAKILVKKAIKTAKKRLRNVKN